MIGRKQHEWIMWWRPHKISENYGNHSTLCIYGRNDSSVVYVPNSFVTAVKCEFCSIVWVKHAWRNDVYVWEISVKFKKVRVTEWKYDAGKIIYTVSVKLNKSPNGSSSEGETLFYEVHFLKQRSDRIEYAIMINEVQVETV